MATDNKDNKLSIGSGDYAEILRHAVAVIEHARTEIARHVNGYVSTAYWEIGQMLHERKIESGYGDSVVRRLSEDLKERYPKMGLLLQKKYPDLPHFLFGHSMGSFFTRRYLCMYPNEVDGAVICGTGWQPKAVLWAALSLTKLQTLCFGDHHRSILIDKLAFGAMNRSFAPTKTPKDWLCRNEAAVEAYIKDEKCGFIFTLNGYRALFRSILLAEKKQCLERMDKDLPVLFISGEADPVGNFGKGVKRAVNAFRWAGMRDVECILYPECRHELINERNREEVFRDVLEWLEFHI